MAAMALKGFINAQKLPLAALEINAVHKPEVRFNQSVGWSAEGAGKINPGARF